MAIDAEKGRRIELVAINNTLAVQILRYIVHKIARPGARVWSRDCGKSNPTGVTGWMMRAVSL